MDDTSGSPRSTVPQVSVVMGVHNGGKELLSSLRSVLDQQGIDLEVIVVDDGSSDETECVLAECGRRDRRLRVLRQSENQGLTKALIRGCSEAQGTYIARQDVGDISLPGRLRAQFEFLELHPEVALVSCWTRTVGPRGEYLGSHCPAEAPDVATRKLLEGAANVTHHGAVMFRASAYRASGGYRQEFYFAQDLDLWYRLLQCGQQAYLPRVLYQTQVAPRCLSSRYRDQQIALAGIIRQLADGRQDDAATQQLLAAAAKIRPEKPSRGAASSTVRGEYWIARMLIRRGDPRAVHYLMNALRQEPLFLRTWYAMVLLAAAIMKQFIQRLFGKKST